MVVGAGPAGVTACDTLREQDPQGRITLIGGEAEPPYSRMAIPYLLIPVRHGRNTASVVEVAARNWLLKVRGHHSARQFQERLAAEIAEKSDRHVMGEVE